MMKKRHVEIDAQIYELIQVEAKRLGMTLKSYIEKAALYAYYTEAHIKWAPREVNK